MSEKKGKNEMDTKLKKSTQLDNFSRFFHFSFVKCSLYQLSAVSVKHCVTAFD